MGKSYNIDAQILVNILSLTFVLVKFKNQVYFG